MEVEVALGLLRQEQVEDVLASDVTVTTWRKTKEDRVYKAQAHGAGGPMATRHVTSVARKKYDAWGC